MKKLLECLGSKCERGHRITVLESAVGFYVGTLDKEGFPNCRLSQYYGNTEDDPIMNIERDCMENRFCNGNQVDGCSKSFLIDSLN